MSEHGSDRPTPGDTRDRAIYEQPDIARWLAGLPAFHGEQVMIEVLRSLPGAVVSDIGAGPGRLCAPILAAGCHYRAIDLSATQIAHLRQRFPQVEAHVADATDLPWRSGSSDAVLFAFHVFEAIRPYRRRLAALREARRILRPGGILFLSHHRRLLYRPAAQLRHRLTRPGRGAELGDLILTGTPRTGGVNLDGLTMHIPGARELRRIARQAGFHRRTAYPLKKPAGRFAAPWVDAVVEEWIAI